MHVQFIFYALLIGSVFAKSKYYESEDDHPYEFGFVVDGQQHRHESKDANGIIMGEFGFITADGVYHVTVYATDENGAFRILSMKNIKISPPLDQPGTGPVQIPAYQNTPSVQNSPRAPNTATTYRPQVRETPVPEVPQVSTSAPVALTTPKPSLIRSCSHCHIPTTTTTTIQPPVSNKNEVVLPDPQPLAPVQPFNVQTPRQENLPPPTFTQSTPPQIIQPQYDVSSPNIYDEPILAEKQVTERIPERKEENIDIRRGGKELKQPELEYPEQISLNIPNGNVQPENYPQQNNPPSGSPITTVTRVNENDPKGPENLSNRFSDTTEDSLPPADPQSPYTGISVSNGKINVPGRDPIPIQDRYPGMVDGLPHGIEKHDIEELLYKFNYTIGFHGHHEKGYKNGAKIGGYFVNGRDGYSRVVTYVADENGYRPKTKLVYLGVDSPLIPKEETEKNFGLVGFEFVWYPLN